ncbi:MAG: NAD-dependent epimerase/dehydratase family protein, partial [Prevotella sp.]|nr:NAD-dependent epimerase/dehydratase family protein [Prevotella sp.]
MKILITGTAGFIGHQLVKVLAAEGADMVGLDVINDYYDPNLKYARLADTGISRDEIVRDKLIQSKTIARYRFVQMDLTDREKLNQLFEREHFTHVCNLA